MSFFFAFICIFVRQWRVLCVAFALYSSSAQQL